MGEGRILFLLPSPSPPLFPPWGSQLNANERRALSTWILFRWRLQQSSSPFLFSLSPHRCLPLYPSCRFPPSFVPPSLFLSRLLHDDIVLTRPGTCNLFVPRSVHGERVLGRYILVLHSFLLSRFSPTSSQNPFYLFATRSLMRVHIRAASPPALSYGVLPRREIIFFFLFFFFFKDAQTRALHRCTCYVSPDARAAELRIKLRPGLEDAASLVPSRPATSSRMEKIRENMYIVI